MTLRRVTPELDASVRRALLAAMRDAGRTEICGFLVTEAAGQFFRRLPNFGGAGEFWIDQYSIDRILLDIKRARSAVIAFVHSHLSHDLSLSDADRMAIRSSPWPWLVVIDRHGQLEGRWYWYESTQDR